MDKETVNEIIACLPKGRTFFYYFKDRYALMLLSHLVGNGKKIAEIRQTPYARLLDKPVIKKVLATAGDGRLSHDLLNLVWDDVAYPFLLTLSTWGNEKGAWQRTRLGCNLVLQLNFSNLHDQLYRRLVKPTAEDTFKYYGHPSLKRGERDFCRETLAWARLDLDFSKDEALIEEIQSDWIREAQDNLREVLTCDPTKPTEIIIYGMAGSTQDLQTYFHKVLKPYAQLWDEAMLTATIGFIRDELGIRKIFYHSYETGCLIKKCSPPRSLYTHLPRKFCFQETEQAPSFLQGEKRFHKAVRKIHHPLWYKLEL
jgi:hypothetical protein